MKELNKLLFSIAYCGVALLISDKLADFYLIQYGVSEFEKGNTVFTLMAVFFTIYMFLPLLRRRSSE